MPTDDAKAPESRSSFSHYLPRLKSEFYQADAVVFWTLPIAQRKQGWLTEPFHAAFREMTLHTAAREGLLCPCYCLMPDHLHFVWMGLRADTDQRNGMKFFRAQLGRELKPWKFQHQAHDHVLSGEERKRDAFAKVCGYSLANPVKAGLVLRPEEWPFSGAMIPGFPKVDPRQAEFWPWFWKRYYELREPDLERRVLSHREME
jgi:REP element-mobilizing transposase RayT